jgi:uncharacterized protein
MKLARFALLTVFGMVAFGLTMTFAPVLPAWAGYASRGGLLAVFGILWLTARGGTLARYRPVFFAFFAAVAGLTLGFYCSDYVLAFLGLTTQTPVGVAVAKASQASLIVIGILVLALPCGENLGSLYLRKGRLLIGLTVGAVAAAVCVFLAVKQPAMAEIGPERLLPLAPWIALFVLSNAFMEELLFRGLFLGRYEPLMGKGLAVLATALVFTLAHMQVTYAPQMIQFLAVTFVFALLWAWLMQTTKSLWGSVLFHAGADVLIILPIFKSLGAI